MKTVLLHPVLAAAFYLSACHSSSGDLRQPGKDTGDFSVRLYETAKTMSYRVAVEWEGLPASDTIKLPDIGSEPHPVLQKGADKSSCVIGFLDNDKVFREIKLVNAKGDQLKISTLKHWVVTDHYRLVSQ